MVDMRHMGSSVQSKKSLNPMPAQTKLVEVETSLQSGLREPNLPVSLRLDLQRDA